MILKRSSNLLIVKLVLCLLFVGMISFSKSVYALSGNPTISKGNCSVTSISGQFHFNTSDDGVFIQKSTDRYVDIYVGGNMVGRFSSTQDLDLPVGNPDATIPFTVNLSRPLVHNDQIIASYSGRVLNGPLQANIIDFSGQASFGEGYTCGAPRPRGIGEACTSAQDCESAICAGTPLVCTDCYDGGNIVPNKSMCCSKEATGTFPIFTCTTATCSQLTEECPPFGEPCCRPSTVKCSRIAGEPMATCKNRNTTPPPGAIGTACTTDADCINGSCADNPNTPGTDLVCYDAATWGQIPPMRYTGKIIQMEELLKIIYKIAVPAAIIISLLIIVKSGYGIMTSEGIPQKVAEAKEDLLSAIMGVVFIMLSSVILRVIITSLIGNF